MNASAQAHRGYSDNAASTRTDRRAEYDVIARVTHRLRDAAKNSQNDFATYAGALHDNNRLWTALAIDVADEGNQLPDSLRARIFYLCEFTRQHTQKILRGDASVMPLLEINVAVLRGLSSGGAGA